MVIIQRLVNMRLLVVRLVARREVRDAPECRAICRRFGRLSECWLSVYETGQNEGPYGQCFEALPRSEV
jgi:hypothetical protein